MNTPKFAKIKDRSSFIITFVLIAIAAIWAIAAVAGISQRNSELAQTEDELVRLNQLVAEQTGSLFREVKGQLILLETWLAANPDKDPRTDKDFIDLVTVIRQNNRIPIDIRLVDKNGGLFYIPSESLSTPRANVADREYFTAQQDGQTRGFYISAPVQSRVTGVWGIPVSYPISSGNVGMAVIFAAIELPPLNELYEAVRPKPSGAISLARRDGTLLDRVPFDSTLMGTSLSRSSDSDEFYEGSRHFISPIDGETRIIAFHIMKDLPLMISVSVSKSDIFSSWYERMLVWIVVLVAVSILLAALGLFLWSSWSINVQNSNLMSAMNEELTNANEMARLVTENSTDVFTVLSLPEMIVEYLSPSVERNWGWKETELKGKTIEALLDAPTYTKVRDTIDDMQKRLTMGESSARHGKLDINVAHKDGHQIPYELASTIICDNRSTPIKIVALARDLSERKANEDIVRAMAFYDRLTGLANRRLLEDRLVQLLPLTLREDKKLAILFIDLDRFKPVNDTYGHEAGDWLLRQVADRMLASLRESDLVARTGGDEFIAVLPDVGTSDNASLIADKIRERISEAYPYDETNTFSISASIGVVLCPDHGRDTRSLLMLSDTAMYQAKKSGRNRVVLYSSDTAALAGMHTSVSIIPWQDSYKSGNDEIDKQHRKLFQMASELIRLASQKDVEKEECMDAIAHVEAHVQEHFHTEETMLFSLGYPDALMHKILHADLTKQLGVLKARYYKEESTLDELVTFIAKTVIDEHLLNEDRRFFYLWRSDDLYNPTRGEHR
ncbi:MAG TPA: diguanylate cyclase [Treponemataceae bacterium]|nr:diguanylate cyclase [Treponemataceae bacterium]